KKAFLVPVAAALAALAQEGQGSVRESAQSQNSAGDPVDVSPLLAKRANEAMPGESATIVNIGGALFGFVLPRTESREVVAQHSSHESLPSHRSHSSSRY